MVGWDGGVSGGFAFGSSPTQTTLSSDTPSVHTRIDQPLFFGVAAIDHPSSMFGFTSGVGGFSWFLILGCI